MNAVQVQNHKENSRVRHAMLGRLPEKSEAHVKEAELKKGHLHNSINSSAISLPHASESGLPSYIPNLKARGERQFSHALCLNMSGKDKTRNHNGFSFLFRQLLELSRVKTGIIPCTAAQSLGPNSRRCKLEHLAPENILCMEVTH